MNIRKADGLARGPVGRLVLLKHWGGAGGGQDKAGGSGALLRVWNNPVKRAWCPKSENKGVILRNTLIGVMPKFG